MPELPEVETIARTLAPQITGQRVRAMRILLPKAIHSGTRHLPWLLGARITRVFRRAKLLLVELQSEEAESAARAPDLLLAFHLKMTGSFFVHPPKAEPLKHTRLIFDLGPAGRLFFDDARTFGWCRVMRADELADWPFWNNLGPEPLELSRKALAGHLASVFAGRRKCVKAALLDQTLLAGVGNIYADEALFRAGIAPAAQAGSLNRARLTKLAGAVQDILRQAIDECGSSIRDYRDADGNAGAFQNNFAVYGRKGENCAVCGGALMSCRVAGRGTVHCPRCQT